MEKSVLFLVVFCVLISTIAVVMARPQLFSRPDWNQNSNNVWNPNSNNDWNQQNNNGNFPITSTSTTPRTGTTVATTASPRFLACMQRCQTTMEYNPVCGSDNINYHNEGRLRCASLCGKNVAAVRLGTCNPL